MKRLRVGIIGCGWAASNRHLPAYRRSGQADIVAVYDRTPARARALARRARARAWSDLDTMLSSGLDAVSICTPPWLHGPQATRALEAGLHVLVEKPMAMTAAECDSLGAAAARAGRVLTVNHNFLFCRSVGSVLADFRNGHAGEPAGFVGFQMSTPRRRLPDWYGRLPGQLFFDEAPHLTYIANELLGSESMTQWARAAPEPDPAAVQRTRQVSYHLAAEGGPGADIQMAFNASRSEWGFAAIGTKRSYLVDMFRDVVVPVGRGGAHTPVEVLRQSLAGLARASWGVVTSGALHSTRRLLYGNDMLVAAFCSAALRGGPPPVPWQQGRDTIAVLEDVARRCGLAPPGPTARSAAENQATPQDRLAES